MDGVREVRRLFQAQAKLFWQIGIPLSRSGRQRKLGRMAGCCVPLTLQALG